MQENILQQDSAVDFNGIVSTEILREHWQGHRRLTRKLIEIFPEEKLFNYSIGGMRPCSSLIMEIIRLAALGLHGFVVGNWEVPEELRKYSEEAMPSSREDILKLWDEVTGRIDDFFATFPLSRFSDVELCFGLYEAPIYGSILYFIDNEIHHRGQAYVYLRSLGVEPPPFWDRY